MTTKEKKHRADRTFNQELLIMVKVLEMLDKPTIVFTISRRLKVSSRKVYRTFERLRALGFQIERDHHSYWIKEGNPEMHRIAERFLYSCRPRIKRTTVTLQDLIDEKSKIYNHKSTMA